MTCPCVWGQGHPRLCLFFWWALARARWGHDDQSWYWTPEWQERERLAEAEIAAGNVTAYDSSEEFLASFDKE